MRRSPDEHRQSREYETLRLLNIGGKYYAFQQQYTLKSMKASGSGNAGVGAVKMPTDNHRLIELSELVDMEKVAAKTLGQGGGPDSMKDI